MWDELLVGDRKALLRDSEAFDIWLLDQHAEDTVLVNREGQVQNLGDGAVGLRGEVEFCVDYSICLLNVKRALVDRVVDIRLGPEISVD